MSELKQGQVDELLAAVSHDYQEVDVAGRKARLRPVTVLELLRLARRFASLAKALEKQDFNVLQLLLDAGPEAVSAFVAVSAGKRGKEAAALEDQLQDAPDEAVLPLVAHALRLTIGEDGLESFFTRILAVGVQAGLLRPDAPAPQPPAA